MQNIQAELEALKREIRDLKTSQTLPGFSKMFAGQADEPAGSYDGIYTWTITFEDADDTNAPILVIDQGVNLVLLPYDSATNTQKIEYYADNVSTFATTHPFYSTRPILSVGSITKTGDRSDYTPPASWTQVRAFNLANMGTDPGWCLRNCCLGFGITGGGFPNARADMNSQKANGTLHDAKGYPPSDIQVPVYIDTGTADGHVVVWDKGTVYSDGTKITNGLSYYGLNNIWGWGELCGGTRVVQKN